MRDVDLLLSLLLMFLLLVSPQLTVVSTVIIGLFMFYMDSL